ncbi:MAG: Iron-sulfur cluster carrier protein [Candidatus Thorarchaeota archaeon AB_25]|nr:MAG: Iron-sulfur cluster carrier protein [Candidatus Thorarchaeota archaeon AB_25]
MIITVASGKGGTGKTTVAVNLALSIGSTNLLDCDVEEPNVHTLLHPTKMQTTSVTVPTPSVDQDKCTLCGKCAEFCQFNAIFVGKTKTMIYEEMCHSCGGCKLVCPDDAITEVERSIGRIHQSNMGQTQLVYGELSIGEPIATTLIHAVKEQVKTDEINILDAPPGTACPVIETMRESDYLVLVTEPTPFGLHDLSMAVDVVRELKIPFGVIINRAGIGDEGVEEFCKENNIPILLEIPFNRQIAELYSRGIPFVQEMPEWRQQFKDLFNHIVELINNGK